MKIRLYNCPASKRLQTEIMSDKFSTMVFPCPLLTKKLFGPNQISVIVSVWLTRSTFSNVTYVTLKRDNVYFVLKQFVYKTVPNSCVIRWNPKLPF